MADFMKKMCTCLWCSGVACCCGSCVDEWWGAEAQGLACLNCFSCVWRSCAPICFDCKMGDCGAGMGDCMKGLKYCLFSCALCVVGPVDGCIACFKAIMDSCSGSFKAFNVMKPNLGVVAEKIKGALSISTSNEPLNTLGTYTP